MSKNNTQTMTVIITCMTDSEKPFLKDAINSVINQTVPCNIRVYLERNNQWAKGIIPINSFITTRYVPLAPPGIIRNLGAIESDSEWIAFLDGDDTWKPNKIELQLKAAQNTNSSILSTDHFLIDEQGKVVACGLGGKNIPMTSSWMVKRNIFSHLSFSDKMTGEDVEWWKKSGAFGKQHRVSSFLLNYRLREISASSMTPSKIRKMKILNASRKPALRYLLIISTWVANKIYTRI
jgi:glycosyltransferase involved in cell wall biosynthesis